MLKTYLFYFILLCYYSFLFLSFLFFLFFLFSSFSCSPPFSSSLPFFPFFPFFSSLFFLFFSFLSYSSYFLPSCPFLPFLLISPSLFSPYSSNPLCFTLCPLMSFFYLSSIYHLSQISFSPFFFFILASSLYFLLAPIQFLLLIPSH